MRNTEIRPRVHWIDACKTYGMALVFYGHLWSAANIPSTAVDVQYKFIYSFHMPLFFVLSGLLVSSKAVSFREFLVEKGLSRLVPVLVFNILELSVLIGRDLIVGQLRPSNYLQGLVAMMRGTPTINAITWFLVCLFTVEVIHRLAAPYLRTQMARGPAALGLLALGLAITHKLVPVAAMMGISPNFWYIHEAIVGYAFFLIGVMIKAGGLPNETRSWGKFGLFAASATLLLLTFDRNHGWGERGFQLVLMVASIHGHPVWFTVSAFAGALAMILFAQLVPGGRMVAFVGRHTLVLLGLNGIFRDLINPTIVAQIPARLLDNPIESILVCSAISALSIAACVPVILLLDRFVPQLVGKPAADGPILPRLLPLARTEAPVARTAPVADPV